MTRDELLAVLADIGRMPDDEALDAGDPDAMEALVYRYAETIQELYELSNHTCLRPVFESIGYGFAHGVYEDSLSLLLGQPEDELITEAVNSAASLHPGERLMAIRCLEVVGGDGVAPVLRRAMLDAMPLVREAAASALAERDGPEVEADLIRALRDPFIDVRLSAVRGLETLQRRQSETGHRTQAVDAGVVLHDLPAIREAIGADPERLVLLDVEAPAKGEELAPYFRREARPILMRYLERFRAFTEQAQDRPIQRVLVLDLRGSGVAHRDALDTLSQVLREAGTLFAPDSRGLWDKVRFLEGDDTAPSLSDGFQIP